MAISLVSSVSHRRRARQSAPIPDRCSHPATESWLAMAKMTGFSGPGGIKTKLRLLAIEGAQLFAE